MIMLTDSLSLFSLRPSNGMSVWQALPRLRMAVLVLCLLAGCSMAPRLEAPEATTSLPDRFEHATEAAVASQHHWWRTFRDPVLDQLVDTALVRNLDLRVAVARVDELQSQYRIARAEQLPQLQLNAGRDEQDTPANVGLGGEIGDADNIPEGFLPDRFAFTTYTASLGFSYEIDFWGRVRGAKQAALREFFASQADMRTATIGVISETIVTYFEITARERTLALTRESINLLAERYALTVERYERGLVSSHERYGVEQQYEETQAGLPVLESQLQEAHGRLGILLGRYGSPLDSVRAPAVNIQPDPVPAGLPSDLLRERPDVLAAFDRLEAARERIGVARAAQFPSFSLTAAGGVQSSTLSDLVKTTQNFWLFGGGLTAPIFNAGAIGANIRASWARYVQQAAAAEKTLLTAFKEVESALIAYDKHAEQFRFLEASLQAARDNADAQERRYARGLGDYMAMLDARRNAIRSEIALTTSWRALVTTRVAVHRALGGAWLSSMSEIADAGSRESALQEP